MKDDSTEPTQDDADTPEGVFGNLPSTRPGSRSPRRRSSEPELAAAEEAVDDAVPEEQPDPEPVPPLEAEAPDDDPDEPEPHQPIEEAAPQPAIQSVEDLAWAGVAMAAQAATAGIRFTSRALEAARKSIDRP